jgi:AraC-type DNA-binding domain-containing proteins
MQKQVDFARIRKAIGYLSENYKSQPTLEQVAEHVHLSPYHFQRMFSSWAGVSPKQFLRYISITHAKKLLKEDKASLLDTTFELGLSSTT